MKDNIQIRKIFDNVSLINEDNNIFQATKKYIEFKQIRNYIFDKVIALIAEKHYLMYGPEKSITAKFIAENFNEIIAIVIKAFNMVYSNEIKKE